MDSRAVGRPARAPWRVDPKGLDGDWVACRTDPSTGDGRLRDHRGTGPAIAGAPAVVERRQSGSERSPPERAVAVYELCRFGLPLGGCVAEQEEHDHRGKDVVRGDPEVCILADLSGIATSFQDGGQHLLGGGDRLVELGSEGGIGEG